MLTDIQDAYGHLLSDYHNGQENVEVVERGQLVEGAPPEDDVHLANLDTDMGETQNLKDEHPELTTELTGAAQTWREGIETHWENEWANPNGTTGYVKK